MAKEIIHVFVIDRNAAWRQAIVDLLTHQPDMRVVGSGSNIVDIFYRLPSLNPDIVLVDALPAFDNGRAMFGHLERTIPNLCFVLHNGFRGEAYMSGLVEAGVKVRLPKGAAPRKILQALREAHHDHILRQGAISDLAGQVFPDL